VHREECLFSSVCHPVALICHRFITMCTVHHHHHTPYHKIISSPWRPSSTSYPPALNPSIRSYASVSIHTLRNSTSPPLPAKKSAPRRRFNFASASSTPHIHTRCVTNPMLPSSRQLAQNWDVVHYDVLWMLFQMIFRY